MCIHTETNGVSYHSTVCFIQSSFPKLTGCKISPIHLRRWTKVYSVTQGLTVPRAGPVPRGALISFWTHYFKRVLPSFPLRGNFMVVQWLGFGTFISGAPGSIPRQGTKIPQALWHDQKKKKMLTLENLESTERKVADTARYHLLTGKWQKALKCPWRDVVSVFKHLSVPVCCFWLWFIFSRMYHSGWVLRGDHPS